MQERVHSPLTARERDVLELMAIGLTNKDIAARLELGARTVETHVADVLGKLNSRTRTSAIAERVGERFRARLREMRERSK